MTMERQQNNLLYQSIEIGAGFRIVRAQPDWAYEFPDRTPKFAGQVLPDRTESGLTFLNILPNMCGLSILIREGPWTQIWCQKF